MEWHYKYTNVQCTVGVNFNITVHSDPLGFCNPLGISNPLANLPCDMLHNPFKCLSLTTPVVHSRDSVEVDHEVNLPKNYPQFSYVTILVR